MGTITCSTGSIAGNTDTDPLAEDIISEYGCTPSNENGNELAWTWVAEGSGEVTFTLEGLTADMDLFGLQNSKKILPRLVNAIKCSQIRNNN